MLCHGYAAEGMTPSPISGIVGAKTPVVGLCGTLTNINMIMKDINVEWYEKCNNNDIHVFVYRVQS